MTNLTDIEKILLMVIIPLVFKALWDLKGKISVPSENGITRREIEEMKSRTKELAERLHKAEGTLKTMEPHILEWIDWRFKEKR